MTYLEVLDQFPCLFQVRRRTWTEQALAGTGGRMIGRRSNDLHGRIRRQMGHHRQGRSLGPFQARDDLSRDGIRGRVGRRCPDSIRGLPPPARRAALSSWR